MLILAFFPFRMPTIEQALQLPNDSNTALEVKVLECSESCKTSTSNKKYFEVVVGDTSGKVNLKVFKEDEHQKFIKHPSLLLQNVIKKTNLFIFTVKSKAFYCAEVHANLEKTFYNTEEAQPATIKDLLQSPRKSNLLCRVVQVVTHPFIIFLLYAF